MNRRWRDSHGALRVEMTTIVHRWWWRYRWTVIVDVPGYPILRAHGWEGSERMARYAAARFGDWIDEVMPEGWQT